MGLCLPVCPHTCAPHLTRSCGFLNTHLHIHSLPHARAPAAFRAHCSLCSQHGGDSTPRFAHMLPQYLPRGDIRLVCGVG